MKIYWIGILSVLSLSLSFSQTMVSVQGGTFQMGSNKNLYGGETPLHTVTVGSFSIDKYEITYEEWTAVTTWGATHGYTDIQGIGVNGYNPVGSNNPVSTVSWFDVVKWCNARSEKEGLTPVYYTDNTLATIYKTGTLALLPNCVKWTANGYRLPTEAEWEFAARGGTKSNNYTYSGSNTIDIAGWYYTNSGTTTHPVGQKAANELGLYDMSGNIWEWCWDWNAVYSSAAQTDPKGPSAAQTWRVLRGGSFYHQEVFSRSLCRHGSMPSARVEACGFRCVGIQSAKLTITNPSLHEVVLANSRYSIKWEATGVDSVKIEYSSDEGKTFHVITPGITASIHGFAWQVPDTVSSKCIVVLTNLNDPSHTAQSPPFRIKGYVLTRFKTNGDYELFDPALHAWQFKNDSASMFPSPWYNQFNYFLTDPITKQQYPLDFPAAPTRAKSSNFVDWPLFVKTFGASVCYENIHTATYSPTALRLWTKNKDIRFMGSCFGFSQSCLLAFDRPDQFRAMFPGVGSFVNIHDRQLTDSLRLVINELYEHQYALQHKLYSYANWKITVANLIAELKTYFLSDTPDHRSLEMTCRLGGHSVVPYRMVQDNGTPGRYRLIVYDNNAPSGHYADGSATELELDSLANAYNYSPLQWYVTGGGPYLNDNASTYLSAPILWDPLLIPTLSTISPSIRNVDATTYLTMYNTLGAAITITNPAGKSIGYHDSASYSTLSDGMPIVPANGTKQPPIGYMIPKGNYTISMSSFTDSLADISVLTTTGMFNYWRTDAVKTQTDRFSYDGGIGVSNRDAYTKSINLEAITRLTGCERQTQILNCPIVQNDSVMITTPDTNRVVLVNFGPAKTYDLKVLLAGANSSGRFSHTRISVPAQSTHYIVPEWNDLKHQSVKIYQDAGNTGKISDSLLATNQATGVDNRSIGEVPGEYYLGQNYPNPFNPSTAIQYSLPQASHVNLVVYNMLGQPVATLVDEVQAAGTHHAVLNMTTLSSGVYFYRLTAGSFVETKKLMLIR